MYLRISIFLLMIIVSYNCIEAHAFDDKKTHPYLTEAATKNLNLKNSLIAFTGYTSGFEKRYSGKDSKNNDQNVKIVQWLQEGSTDEDALNFCRASNHFHNPIHSGDWSQSQMSDSGWVDKSCGNTKRFSDVTWATGLTAPDVYIGERIGQYLGSTGLYDARQDMGWDNARGYLYEALSSIDPAIREEKFVKTFRAVGQVLHLLQDMAVPAHVRNDMESHLFNAWNPSNWGNAFEKYIVAHSDARNNNPEKPSFVTPIRVSAFWDTNSYTGNNPSVGMNQGLAEYANANYFSDSTIPQNNPSSEHQFPYPQITEANYICTDKLPESGEMTKYVSRTPCPTDGSAVDHFAAVSLLNPKGTLVPSIKKVWLDNNVHDTYAQKILPRAVGYSAALLDYFFRGKLSITPATDGITFRAIKLIVANNTPNEVMEAGEVRLVIRYKALSETAVGGGKYRLENPTAGTGTADYAYKVSAPQNVNLTSPQELTFDFADEPLPYFFADMTMQLVFKGKLGNEEGAVAVSPITGIDGVYTDFALSLPTSGVYAKATDLTSSATFNELHVNAMTDITGGLTGGTFKLALEYRQATADPFMSQPVDTEPVEALGYVIRLDDQSGATGLQPGIPAELVFNLADAPLPVWATDVHLNIIYLNSATGKPKAIGVKDISEPTPVDVFNNADKICINNQWYTAGSAAAIALSDSNGNGSPDLFDPYGHNITDILAKDSSLVSPILAAADNYTFSSPAALPGGTVRRLGYILTDYSFKYSFLENWVSTFDSTVYAEPAEKFTGTAIKNQTDSGGNYIWPSMYTIRGQKMWWGAGIIFDNAAYPVGNTADAACGWSNLP